MKTITIQIGNSDDKLSQKQWSDFVEAMTHAIGQTVKQIHFFGGPPNWFDWQNVAWVAECAEESLPEVKKRIEAIRMHFNQASVAFTEGETQFI